MGWACIALRAYRVKAVFDAYDEYLKMLSSKDNTNESIMDTIPSKLSMVEDV